MSFDQIDYRLYLDQNKLKESDRFQPVFEAAENALNAIEERFRLEPGSPEGLVTITINRRAEQRTIGYSRSLGANFHRLKLLASPLLIMESGFETRIGPLSKRCTPLTRSFTAGKV